MDKVFLSHSSQDKGYVSYIAEQFGKDRCVYDSMCFEAGMKNLDEIFREMGKTSLFVFFISENSLKSQWVQRELTIAGSLHDEKKLAQIFPIIIDPNITYQDERIPEYMRKGFGSYNLSVITSKRVAYRKIKTQHDRFIAQNTWNSKVRVGCFYGRDEEIRNFKHAFDVGEGIKVLVASGFTGMGRKTYMLQCLIQSGIIDEYYNPPIISLRDYESIEDLIVKLSEIGFGDYTLRQVTALPDMNAKIDALSSVLKMIQNYREQVVIYDSEALINRRGELVYWFEKALANIRNEVTVLIASKYSLNSYSLRHNKYVFAQPVSALPQVEWMGLMRIYAQNCQMDLSHEDRAYFKNILTGYPPQVIYCVDLMKDTSVAEVKDNPRLVIDLFSSKVSELLESAFKDEMKEPAYGFLAFASAYGIVPWDLLEAVIKISEKYQNAFSLCKSLTICRYLGINNEYIEVNPVINDYIQRGGFSIPEDINSLLTNRLNELKQMVENEKEDVSGDFEDLKYYLKRSVVSGEDIPEGFKYSTLYLSSINELYNKQKYKQIIILVEKLKENGSFELYDISVQKRIQGFYCRSLARETNSKFYEEVEFFKRPEIDDYIQYDFLRGFMYRNNSEYDKALDRYTKVLKKQPNHKSTMREIVVVYRGLEDIENAYEYAKINYKQEKENPYQIQPYFEILIRKPKSERSEQEQEDLAEMMRTITRLHSVKPSTTYYELLAQHALYEEGDSGRAVALLKEGLKKFPDSSYIIKVLFDCLEFVGDVEGMDEALAQMEPLCRENKAVKTAYDIRMVLTYAHKKKPREFIYTTINEIKGLNEETKERLKKKVNRILQPMG